MEKSLKLYTYVDGVNDTPFPSLDEQAHVSAFTYNAKRMGDAPIISFTLMHTLCLDNLWTTEVYTAFNGEKYFLRQTPTSEYNNADSRYKHTVEMVSERVILNDVYFFDVVSNDTENDKPVSNSSNVVFFGDIHEFVSRLNFSLAYSHLDYHVIVDEDVTSEGKLMSFDNQFFANVLQEIYNTYELPYYFVGKEIHIGNSQYVLDEIFEYGVDKSLLSVTKSNANYKVINRCTGIGSEDNIPYYYPNTSPYGEVAVLYNGATNDNVAVYDWGRFVRCGLSGMLTYREIEGAEDVYSNLTLDDFETYEVKHLTTLLDQPIYGWVGVCEFSVPKASCTIDIEIGNKTVGSSYVEIRDENDIPIWWGQWLAADTLHLGYGTYKAYVTFGIGSDDYEAESIARDNCYIKFKVKGRKDATYNWLLNDETIVSLGGVGVSFIGTPSVGDVISFKLIQERIPVVSHLMPSIYRETRGAERFYNAKNGEYVIPNSSNEYYEFENPYIDGKPKEHIVEFPDIKPTIKGMTNAAGERIDMFIDFAYDLDDNDELNEEGNYKHPYFYAKLRKFDGEYGFNLFAHAIEGNPMTIAMTSGNCGACEWTIGVDDSTQLNVIQVYEEDTTDADGTFHEKGSLKRNAVGDVLRGAAQDIQNDTRTNEVWIALRKDINTFGVVMPNAANNYRPSAGDTFVILHISLPQSYIDAAENRLRESIIEYMSQNNSEKFNFSIKFSRIYLEQHPDVLSSLTENTSLKVMYDGVVYKQHVSSYSYKMTTEQPLPEITVELTDTLTVHRGVMQNVINQVKGEIDSRLSAINVETTGTQYFVSKTRSESIGGQKTLTDKVIFGDSIESADFEQNSIQGTGWSLYKDAATHHTVIEVDKLIVRKELEVNEIVVNQSSAQKGTQIISQGGCKIEKVEEYDTYYRCYYDSEQGTQISGFVVGDQACCQRYDEAYEDIIKYYWRLVVNATPNYIDLSKEDYDGSGIPDSGDAIVQLGNRNDEDRQNAIVISTYPKPSITQYDGIDSYTLPDPTTRISPNDNLFTGKTAFQAGSSGLENLEEWADKQQQINNANANASQALSDLNAFKSSYNSTINRIEGQLDKKADTWYQSSDPSQNWTTNDEKQAHIGDLWYNTTIGQSFMWNGTEWVTQGVPDEVFDTIDGKSSIFVLKPESYRANDIWVLETDYDLSEHYVKGTWVVALQTSDTFEPTHWKKLDTYADKDYISKLETGSTNLLRNSGFTGDYISTSLKGNTSLNNGTQMFSPSLQHWGTSDVIAQESDISQSGVEVVLSNGIMAQTLKIPLLKGEKYIFSFRGKGEYISYEIGSNTNTITLSGSWSKYVERFTATSDSTIFTISGKATLCELQITHGDIVSAWSPSVWDNSSELAYYQTLQYLSNAIKNGSTTVLGGLLLSNILLMGNVSDDVLEKNTAGVSGIYTDDTDVAFWAGGTMEQAIRLVQLLTDNPHYQPTDAEWATLAKFAATHGGDVFIRGYIYAMGGLFKGAVSIANGKIRLNADGSGSLASGGYSWDKNGVATLKFPNTVQWINIADVTDINTRVVDITKGGFLDEVFHNDGFNSASISHFLPTPPIGSTLVLRGPAMPTRSTEPALITSLDGVRFMALDNSNDDYYLGDYIYASKISFTAMGRSKGEITLTYQRNTISQNDKYVWLVETAPSYVVSKDNNRDVITIS